ncbi:hypothetical protein LCGC14_0829560 [marine sediment metagenome]|uniref:Uncharacterized protein n=1 Tax=marine sediment metagenome TaxID=412755 RepID=A0A0F9S172_9ZZZZ
MTISVPTVAFGFMAPDALRVFLQIAGYRVSIFNGEPESLDFRQDKPEANIVILPNFAKRSLLAKYADQIGRLVVLTNGRHEKLIELDIPILDGSVDGEELRQSRDKTPHFYTKKVSEAAVPLELQRAAPVVPEPARDPSTLDEWFTAINDVFPDGGSFDHDVEYPVCQHLTGQLSPKDLMGAMKVLVKSGADRDVLRAFYKWLMQQSVSMSAALQAYLMPTSESAAMDVRMAAKKFKIDPVDIELLESIYLEMQKSTEEGAE